MSLSRMNVLISSVGRQSFLVQSFQSAHRSRGSVFVADYNPDSPAFIVADKSFIAPSFSDPQYINWILHICQSENINLLFTLNVDDLFILESHRKEFENIGCRLIGGPLESIIMSMDKFRVMQFCENLGLPAIKTKLKEEQLTELSFPIIAKPRYGKGSRGMKFLYSEAELNSFLTETESIKEKDAFVFQEVMKGEEYGFDIINDFNRNFAAVLVRRKISMKNGETEEAITLDSEPWIQFAQQVSSQIQHEGLIDIDAIVIDNQPYIMDINFRFGGGYIFSHLAGADVPRAYIAWSRGETAKQEWFTPEPNITHCRSVFQKYPSH